MMALPVAFPVTAPVVDTDAIAGLLLIHVPPASVEGPMAIVCPMHTVPDPVRVAGLGLTIILSVAKQPVGIV
jgi:hypothetical protein